MLCFAPSPPPDPHLIYILLLSSHKQPTLLWSTELLLYFNSYPQTFLLEFCIFFCVWFVWFWMLLTTVVRSRNLIITAIFSPIFATLSTHYYPLPLLPPCCSPISPHWCTLLYPSPCNLTYPLSPPPTQWCSPVAPHPTPPYMLLFTLQHCLSIIIPTPPPPPMYVALYLCNLVYPLLLSPPPPPCCSLPLQPGLPIIITPPPPPPCCSLPHFVTLSTRYYLYPHPSDVLLLLLHPTSPCMSFFPFLCDLDYPAMFSCCSSMQPFFPLLFFSFLCVWPELPNDVLLLLLHPTPPCMLLSPCCNLISPISPPPPPHVLSLPTPPCMLFSPSVSYLSITTPALHVAPHQTPPCDACCSFPLCTYPLSPPPPPPCSFIPPLHVCCSLPHHATLPTYC